MIFTQDSFTGGAGTLLENHAGEVGATWAKNAAFASGSAALTAAGRLRGNSVNAVYYASGVPGGADGDLEADVFVATIAGAFGLTGRQNSAAATYYLFDYETGAVAWKLYAIVNGSTLASAVFSQAVTIGQTYRVRLSMRGSVITGYVNGAAVVTLNDGNISAAGRAGLFFGQADTDSTGLHVDNVVASTPSVLGPTDGNLQFSPYNWYSDGAGAMQRNNIRGGSTLAKSNTPGAYLKLGIMAAANGYAALLLNTASLSGITAGNCPTIIYSLDGQAFVAQLLAFSAGAVRVVISTNLAAGNHTLSVYFRGATLSSSSSAGDRWNTPASAVTVLGVELDGKGSAGAAAAVLGRNLLVLGDSITEGADAVGGSNANADQDASQAYGQMLGAALGAEVGIVGFSAQGWVAGGYGNVPRLYDPATPGGATFDKYFAGASRLIGGAFAPGPDYVAVLMGQNDSAASDAAVTAAVTGWMGAARAAAPQATLLVIVPLSGIKRAAVTAGVAAAVAAGDRAAYLIDLGTAVAALLLSGGAWTNDGIHPNVRGHAQFGALLAGAVRALVPTAAAATVRNLQVQTTPAVTSGTMYGIVRDAAANPFNGAAFVVYASADRASYATVAMAHVGSGFWAGDFPAAITAAGQYTVAYSVRAGATPAESDGAVGTQKIRWTGVAEQAYINISVTPITGQISYPVEVVDDIEVRQHSAQSFLWPGFVDAGGAAVNLSGKRVSFRAVDVFRRVVIAYDTAATPGNLVVSGTGSNAVLLTFDAGDTAGARPLSYVLWNATDDLPLASGRCDVVAGVGPG